MLETSNAYGKIDFKNGKTQWFETLQGLVDAEKQEKNLSSNLSLQEKALQIAISEIQAGGVDKEKNGSNLGYCEKYLQYAGVPSGSPWCCCFVYFCIDKAGGKFTKTGYCPTAEAWAINNNILSVSPDVGDAFLLYDNLGCFHTGLVEKIISPSIIGTIEGNTSPDGSPEGYGVFRRERPVKNCKFIKWWKL